MDLKQLIMLAFLVSITCLVFGFGLTATFEDMLYLVRRPGLLARSLLSVFVIMPVVAVVLDRLFVFRPEVEIVLVTLALSPVPPLLPRKLGKAGGNSSYVLGLMATLALLSIVFVPLSIEILQRFLGRQFGMAPSAIAGIVLKTTLLPLTAGLIVRAALPHVAARIEKPLDLFGKVLLTLAALALLVGSLPAIWVEVGDGTIFALFAFLVVGMAVGHVLGGPNPDNSVDLALATACRHPAVALTIAAANYPEQRFVGTILLYLLVGVVACIPYIAWQKRQVAVA
jgi:bile acid:Na+ symporter, BASS family